MNEVKEVCRCGAELSLQGDEITILWAYTVTWRELHNCLAPSEVSDRDKVGVGFAIAERRDSPDLLRYWPVKDQPII